MIYWSGLIISQVVSHRGGLIVLRTGDTMV